MPGVERSPKLLFLLVERHGDELQKPLDLEGLAAQVRSPQAAAEVYAASLLAIEVDTPAERDYLRRLAGSLGLDDRTVQRVHQIMNAPAVV